MPSSISDASIRIQNLYSCVLRFKTTSEFEYLGLHLYNVGAKNPGKCKGQKRKVLARKFKIFQRVYRQFPPGLIPQIHPPSTTPILRHHFRHSRSNISQWQVG